jgi:hypothetical protein
MKNLAVLILLFCFVFSQNSNLYNNSAFRQIDNLIPDANEYRTASGVPGERYWQQKVDYQINVVLDEVNLSLSGSELVTYLNKSPNTLSYIWMQLDQNAFAKNSNSNKIKNAGQFPSDNEVSIEKFDTHEYLANFKGGNLIKSVTTFSGEKLEYKIVGTMMRVDLKSAIKKNEKAQFKIEWSFNIIDATKGSGRSGYEMFKDSNYVFLMAQFFPRAFVYDDGNAWQHKEFLGRGEFALEFGDYDVKMTVPADHVLWATGNLENETDVLTAAQIKKFNKQKISETPDFIISPEEAKKNEKNKSTKTKTWHFKAENVRDFAFSTSRKFIWDAASIEINGKRKICQSFYPNEAMPLWDKYSTHLVRHTLKIYSQFTFDYPYPYATSVHAPDNIGGMEYPMICFNSGRPEEDGTYEQSKKEFLILVIIHEVGHNFFPMIVSSDERQWSWMDEGLNSFLQYQAERLWDPKFNSGAGPADLIVDYMKNPDTPIMTNSEAIAKFGANAYDKPTAGLNILRESILGRELFDFAFKRYSKEWMFKHPKPADFFRVMEDASGVDLDWFWRGWFFTTKYVNQSIEKIEKFTVDNANPENKKNKKIERDSKELHITDLRNNILDGGYEGRHKLSDFYSTYEPLEVYDQELEEYKNYINLLNPRDKDLINNKRNYYRVTFENVDDRSMVMPLILGITYADGSKEELRLPAEIWQLNEKKFVKELITNKEIVGIVIDPKHEFPDIDRNDNSFPRVIESSEFGLFKEEHFISNPMREAKDIEEEEKAEKEEKKE